MNSLLDELDVAGADTSAVLSKLRELYRVEEEFRDVKVDADAVIKERAAQKKKLASLAA